MAIGIQSCKNIYIFLIFLVYSLQETDGSFIKSSVTSSSIRVDVRDINTSLREISYSTANASSIINVVRFTGTHSTYTITCLKNDTTYILNITSLTQDHDQSVDETIALTTTESKGSGDEDDVGLHPVLFILIGISALCGVLLFTICIMLCAKCCCRSEPENTNRPKHVEKKSSLIQRMRRRRHDRETELEEVPCEDITNYTNSIPGWKVA